MNLKDEYIHGGKDGVGLIRNIKSENGVISVERAQINKGSDSATIPWVIDGNKINIVNTFASKIGEITIRGGLTDNGSINLTMSGNQLQASAVGLKNFAFKESILSSDLPLASNTAKGAVIVGDTLSSTSGYTACHVKDGVIYYKNETHTSDTYTGTVKSVKVTATSPLKSSTDTALTETLDTTISLSENYGDILNPYGSKTAHYFLAAPSNSNGTPSFRSIVASDIPALSASKITSGTFSADRIPSINLTSKVSGILPVANGGTGADTLTGLLFGNGTSAITASTPGVNSTIPKFLTVTTNANSIITPSWNTFNTSENTVGNIAFNLENNVLSGKVYGWKNYTTSAPDSTSGDDTIPTSKAVYKAMLNTISTVDAIVYRGIITGDTLPAANKGDLYKINKAGTLSGVTVEVGDMIICNTDETPANTPANWDFILANLDPTLYVTLLGKQTITGDKIFNSIEATSLKVTNTIDGNATTSTTATNVNGGYCSLANETSNWNFSHLSNKIIPIYCHDTVATGAPGAYYSGLSIITKYNGFLLATYGGKSQDLKFRKVDGAGTWHDWHELIHSENYNSYSPTLTGEGASGTWSISITGNSNTATKASSIKGIIKTTMPSESLSAGEIKYYYNILRDATGNMPCTSNGNGILMLNRHDGDNHSFLGFSGNGRIYYKTSLSTDATWNKVAWTSDIPSSLPANGGTADYATSAGTATAANSLNNLGMLDTQEKIDNFLTGGKLRCAVFKTSEANNLGFKSNDGMILSIPFSSNNYGAQIAFDDTRSGLVKVRGKQSTWGDWYTLLHSGNYNSYAPKLDGTGASGTWSISVTGSSKYVTNSTYDASGTTIGEHKVALSNAIDLQTFGIGHNIIVSESVIRNWSNDSVTVKPSSVYSMIKIGGGYSGSAYGQWLLSSLGTLNPLIVGRINNKWTEIKTLAFTSDNVASATKLQTSRTIWGQSFDGTGNVSGSLTGVSGITFVNNGTTYSSYGNPVMGETAENWTVYSSSASAYFTVKKNGNVGIGTISPSEKLHVDGNILSSGTVTANGFVGNLTGNAATATNVEWSGVVNRPTKLSDFTDDLGSSPVHTHSQYLTSHQSLESRLYTSLVSISLNDNTNWAKTTANTIRRGFIYNSNLTEWSYLFGLSTLEENALYGAILKMGYLDKYLRILRVNRGSWLSTDWEKISAGYADKAGTAINVEWSGVTNKPTFINSFGTKTGDITVRGGLSTNGSVNLIMSDNELQASIVGLGSNAYSSTAYLPLSGGTITGTLGKSNNYIFKPDGGDLRESGPHKGAICISLPVYIGYSMLSMWIDVYNYKTNTSFSVHVGGYMPGYSTIEHPFAMVYGASHKVRFALDNGLKIYIGETNTTWLYPQISVRDVVIGYSSDYPSLCTNWNISFVTSFPTIDAEISRYAITTDNISNQSVSYAISASKLINAEGNNYTAGSASVPVYFSDGKPVACTLNNASLKLNVVDQLISSDFTANASEDKTYTIPFATQITSNSGANTYGVVKGCYEGTTNSGNWAQCKIVDGTVYYYDRANSSANVSTPDEAVTYPSSGVKDVILVNNNWSNATNGFDFSSLTGTYAILILDYKSSSSNIKNCYSGTITINGNVGRIDEIPLHTQMLTSSDTAVPTRIYAAMEAGILRLCSQDASNTHHYIKVKLLKLMSI